MQADLDNGVIRDITTGESFTVAPFPPFIQEIIACGGIAGYVKKKMLA